MKECTLCRIPTDIQARVKGPFFNIYTEPLPFGLSLSNDTLNQPVVGKDSKLIVMLFVDEDYELRQRRVNVTKQYKDQMVGFFVGYDSASKALDPFEFSQQSNLPENLPVVFWDVDLNRKPRSDFPMTPGMRGSIIQVSVCDYSLSRKFFWNDTFEIAILAVIFLALTVIPILIRCQERDALHFLTTDKDQNARFISCKFLPPKTTRNNSLLTVKVIG